jgi:group I intron endonuclease
LLKISEAKSGKNNPMFDKTGENNPFYGKTHTPETLAKLSFVKSGKNNPMFGKTRSPETLAKISAAKGGTIYVYNTDKSTLINSFPSARKAGEHFKVSYYTILKYSRNGLLFQDKWILSTYLISPIGDCES